MATMHQASRTSTTANPTTLRSPVSAAELCASPQAQIAQSLMARLGGKWTMLTVALLGERRRRFSELAELVPGISRRMLTVTLRALERDALVTRTVYPEVPVRVEYELTELGKSLRQVAEGFAQWVWQHLDEIEASRVRRPCRCR